MPNLLFEKRHGYANGKIVCGVDEAGRGPLAGPVTAAALILPPDLPRAITKEIRDSKKMTARQREDLFDPLMQTCRISIAEASVAEIARYNILWASMLAMKRAVEGLEKSLFGECQMISPPLAGGARGGVQKTLLHPPPNLPLKGGGTSPLLSQGYSFQNTKIDVALIDGNRCPQLECKAVAIIKGDDRSLSIAAASIIAKVTRDRLMKKLAEEHPGYGWERNAGYGTREHVAALRQLGATIWHRPSFAPVMQLGLELEAAR